MSFFISPKTETALDLITERMAQNPAFGPRYDAIKEIRENQPEIGGISRHDGFYRVASLQGTLESLANVLNPQWLMDKRRFYAWLDAHPQHCTYDRRREKKPNQVTLIDGKIAV